MIRSIGLGWGRSEGMCIPGSCATFPPKPPQQLSETGEAIREGMDQAGEKVKEGAQQTGHRVQEGLHMGQHGTQETGLKGMHGVQVRGCGMVRVTLPTDGRSD